MADISNTEPQTAVPLDGNEAKQSVKEQVPVESQSEPSNSETKPSKRRFWSLGRKSPDGKEKNQNQAASGGLGARVPPVAPLRPVSPMRSPERLSSSSPKRGQHPYGGTTSPGLSALSPRPHSPASSQIFERNVQEEVLPPQASPSIPSHIITENHIPSVLEEASAAITDNKLDPDSVEIVTHTLHQPAALTVTGTPLGEQSLASSVMEESSPHRDFEDTMRPNVSSRDVATDVRRLSFVSFADVVHAEQAAEAEYPHVSASQRSTSPLHSPTSSHGFGTSPPTSVSPSFKPFDSYPNNTGRVPGSPLPLTQSPSIGGELNVETMRQALRKTGSGDLSGVRSGMLSTGAIED